MGHLVLTLLLTKEKAQLVAMKSAEKLKTLALHEITAQATVRSSSWSIF
jgi:hypothetical protein